MSFRHVLLYFGIIISCAAGKRTASQDNVPRFQQPPAPDSSGTQYGDDLFQVSPDDVEGKPAPPDPAEKQVRADLFQIPADMPDDVKKVLDNITGIGSVTFSMGNANRGYRSGSATEGDICHQVYTSVPRHLTFITRYRHYRKYTHAYNIPIVSTSAVDDRALKRACYVLRFLLADKSVLRRYLYSNYGRIGIMGRREGTTSIPEHRHLGRWWDTRARGLGGTLAIPISTGAEENLMCWTGDRYPREDIFLHEFSHGIQEIAIRGGGIRGYFGRLQRAYNSARYSGRWRRTYAMSTVQEYFAEGTQSYFEVNDYSPTANNVHGPINTRAKLMNYDRTLYNLVREVFPCQNNIWKRCDASKGRRAMPVFEMNCDGRGTRKKIGLQGDRFVVLSEKKGGGKKGGGKKGGGKKGGGKKGGGKKGKGCLDKNQYCSSWAGNGYCKRGAKYYGYMMSSCKKSCNKCPTKCVDKNVNCASWSRSGYCRNTSYGDFMKRDCKKSCNVCG